MENSSESLNRGLAAFKAGDYAVAVNELENATRADHKDFQAFLYLGAAYSSQGRLNAAIGAFRRASEIRPDDARVHYNLGQAYEAAGVPREALHSYEQALKFNPYHALAQKARASVKSQMSAGRIEVAA